VRDVRTTGTLGEQHTDSITAGEMSTFLSLLRDQIRNEFTASQQYTALAVWFDARDLPQMANHFYQQAVEERNHAMMMVRYMLDRDLPIEIPGIAPVRNDFSEPADLVKLAVAQEEHATHQIEALFRAARADDDVLGEQFMLWFIKEQIEEVASMKTLLAIAERAGTDWFEIENYLAREAVGDDGADASAPQAAGGAL
jgi:ferritin